MLQLQADDFYKSEVNRHDNTIWIDYYKADDLLGQSVYIHFRIDEKTDKVVIESFKRK